jgi:rod shape-determining protein MreC
VKEGDRILTSGDGGVLPRGLPVGTAVKGLDGRWRVVLASDRTPIDFVRILLFEDFTQVLNSKQLDVMPVPPPTQGSQVVDLVPPTPAAKAAPPAATPPSATPGVTVSAAAPTQKPATPKPTTAKPAVSKPATPKPTASAASKPATPTPTASAAPKSGPTTAKPPPAPPKPKPPADEAPH